MIRAFVAVLLDDGVRATISAAIERLRPLGRAVAWVPPQNLHLTLQFLGRQSAERLAAAEAAMGDAAARSAPFDVAFHGIGAFPGFERPRILWIGLAKGALEMRALQARMADALAAQGFTREERPWHPHLTVGRVFDERRWRREADIPLRSALAELATATFGTLRVTELALMRSDLSPAGARYSVHWAVQVKDVTEQTAIAAGRSGRAERTAEGSKGLPALPDCAPETH